MRAAAGSRNPVYKVQLDVIGHAALIGPLPVHIRGPCSGDDRVVETTLDTRLEARARVEQRDATKDVVATEACIAVQSAADSVERRQKNSAAMTRRHDSRGRHAPRRTGVRAAGLNVSSIMVANWSHAVPIDAPPLFADAHRP